MSIGGEIRRRAGQLLRREEGTQLIELAIVLPILILMFAATAELGRLFHTYTTLAKATKVGARHLSIQKSVNTGDVAAKNLVLCGNPSGCGGDGQPKPVVDGLTANDIVIIPPPAGVGTKYVTVQINYQYSPLVFDLEAMTGSPRLSLNLALSPSTTMRYMRN